MNYFSKYLKKDLFQVIFHVTFRCNAQCVFCFNWKDINTNLKEELSLEEIEKISASMPGFPWLMLSGGEPILRKDLAEIIQIFYKNNKIKHVTLPTNGLLPDVLVKVCEDIIAKCPKLTLTVSLSLDAIGEAHDRMRNVKGCYEKVIESFKAIQPLRENKRLNVKFHTVITNETYKEIDSVINKVRQLKPDMHTIEFVRGELRDENIHLPPAEEIPEIAKKIKENYAHYGGYSNLKGHFSMLQKVSGMIQNDYLDLCQEIFSQKKQVIPCLAHRLSLTIYPYGDVSFCEPLKQFGNIRNYNLSYKELLKSEEAKKQAEIIKTKKCSCYHPCYQYLNIVFNKKRMIKNAVKNVF